MTDPTTHHDKASDNRDVSAGLRAALRDRPAPPPTWDLHAIKARGRRRRTRARVLPVAAGLVVIAGLGVGAVRTGASWPWTATTTTVAAPANGDPVVTITGYPEGVARDAWARSGTVGWADGCLVMGEALLVWPQGSTWDPATQQVVLPGGIRIGIGDSIETWGSPLHDLAAYLGQDGAASIAACGGVDVPAGGAARDGRPVLEVSTFQG